MTWALCFHCGGTKFGAICECEECGAGSTGDISLDIAFSDHRMDVETLREFGEVVRSIRRVCPDDELAFWSFVSYVSSHHADILGVNLDDDRRRVCEEILSRAQPPPVTVRESERARVLRELEERGVPAEGDP